MDIFLAKSMLAAGAAISLLFSAPAHATGSGCAVVKHTSDGFAALRAEPSVRSPMIRKLSSGQMIWIVSSGAWQGWYRVDRLLKLEAGKVVNTEIQEGYVSVSLTEFINC
jgi:hypothetical protein